MLNFSASYQNGSNSRLVNCSSLSDNCTAELTVDIIPSIDTTQSLNVIVSGPYGSNSFVSNPNLG